MPPNAGPVSSCHGREQGGNGLLTSVVHDSLPGPVLDNHGQRADALVYIHVGSYHARVLQSEGVVDVHVAGKLELRVPYFDDGHLGRRDTDDLLHSI